MGTEVENVIDLLRPYLGNPVSRITFTAKGPQIRFHCPTGCDSGRSESTGTSRKPAFVVNLQTGLAFCHRCDEGWSLQGLLAKLGASRTVRAVASEFIKEVPRGKRRARKKDTEDFILPEALLGVFHRAPTLLLDNGFNIELLREHDVGYDLVHDRITYPVRDHHGRLRAVMGGRTSPEQEPKYLLYGKDELQPFLPDLPIPEEHADKSSFVWNFDKIWASCYVGSCESPIVIVEGFKAALWVIQSGHPMTIAVMGHYISEEQVNLLLHFGNKLLLFFDQDEYGQKATGYCVPWFRKKGARIAAVPFPRPEAIQPDWLEPEEVLEAIAKGDNQWVPKTV